MTKTVGSKVREEFSARLRSGRELAGFKTARAFARDLGIDENRYTRYERAEVEPNLQLLVQISERLGLSPNELLGLEPIGDYAQAIGGGGGGAPGRVPGFADDGEHAQYAAGPEHRSGAAGDPRWQLAEALARLAVREAGETADELAEISQAADLYAGITADPVRFVAGLRKLPGVDAATTAERDAIARLVREVIGSRPTSSAA